MTNGEKSENILSAITWISHARLFSRTKIHVWFSRERSLAPRHAYRRLHEPPSRPGRPGLPIAWDLENIRVASRRPNILSPRMDQKFKFAFSTVTGSVQRLGDPGKKFTSTVTSIMIIMIFTGGEPERTQCSRRTGKSICLPASDACLYPCQCAVGWSLAMPVATQACAPAWRQAALGMRSRSRLHRSESGDPATRPTPILSPRAS
jgi:hypothetical protein